MKNNAFLLDKEQPSAIRDRRAVFITLISLCFLCKNEELDKYTEDWLERKIVVSGAIYEDDCRNFIKLVKNHPEVVSHPYIAPCIAILSANPDNYMPYKSEEGSAVFNLKSYINKVCKKDPQGRVVGFCDDIVKNKYDEDTAEEIGDAFEVFSSHIDHLSKDKSIER